VLKASEGRRDTRYAGLIPMARFSLEQLQVRARMEPKLAMEKGRNATFTPMDEAMAYLAAQMAGIARLNHLDQVLPETILAQVFQLPRWPSENTQQRFLRRANEDTLKSIDELTEKWAWEQWIATAKGPIEVDGDVTGIPQRARKREGVRSGYCGGRARPCYQLPRVTVNGLPWWSDLRPGNDGCVDLFDQTLKTAIKVARKRPETQVRFRLDGYFASKGNIRLAIYHATHLSNLKFLLVVHPHHMKEGRWEELVDDGQPWTRINSTTHIKELGKVRPWRKETNAVRAIAVRREKTTGRRAGKERWDARYLIVTNLSPRLWKDRDVFRGYHQRQRIEFSFKDGKQSLPMAKMPTMKFQANRAHTKMATLAQLILHLFARKFLPRRGSYGPMCNTVRQTIVAIDGTTDDHGAITLRPTYYGFRWLDVLRREADIQLRYEVTASPASRPSRWSEKHGSLQERRGMRK
jgi:hypothetical protein